VVEAEPGNDRHAPQQEHDEHHRHQRELVGAQPPQIHPYEGPEEGERQPHPDRPPVQRFGGPRPPHRIRDVAQKRNQHVGDDPDRDRQPEPLRKARHESPVRAQRAAHVDVAAARPRHGRGQAGVGKRRQQGGERREGVRGQHMGPDTGHASLQHDRDDVDRRPEHGADAGRGQAQQTEAPAQSGSGGHLNPGARCREVPSRPLPVAIVALFVPDPFVHPVASLRGVPPLRGPHGHVAGARGLHPGQRKAALQPGALATRTGRARAAQHQALEVQSAIFAGIFVYWHGTKVRRRGPAVTEPFRPRRVSSTRL